MGEAKAARNVSVLWGYFCYIDSVVSCSPIILKILFYDQNLKREAMQIKFPKVLMK